MFFDQHLSVARPWKMSEQDIVEYEMDMLRFAWTQINTSSNPIDGCDYAGYMRIECFLLHYRNVIEFLGCPDAEKRRNDLSLGKQVGEESQTEIEAIAKPVRDKYQGDISRYLAHCTTQRHEIERDWKINEMYAALLPAVNSFRSALRLASF